MVSPYNLIRVIPCYPWRNTILVLGGYKLPGKDLTPWPKIQTGRIGTMPELGRMSDWLARASTIFSSAAERAKKLLLMSDGTHSFFLKNLLWMRTMASINACNSDHRAGFSDVLPTGTDPQEVATPFPIDQGDIMRRYTA